MDINSSAIEITKNNINFESANVTPIYIKEAEESYRVLKKNKICAVMMGDIRKYGNVVPLGFRTMEKFLQAGFQSKEIIIKEQHNCMSTKYWKNRNNNFLLIAHEYIFVFQK